MTDARFEDAREEPLRLKALTQDDLQVISALTQDGVFPATEMTFRRPQRRFALLLNRFRWEDPASASQAHAPERVQSVLAFEDVMRVQCQGIDRNDRDLILSLLSVSFEPGEDGTGRVLLTLAGDGAVALQVETLEATLKDVTRPYVAPSRKVPDHP